jgi:hypothetical protein
MNTHADFQDIKVYPRFPDRVVLQWSVINAFQSGIYTFSIYRSDNPTSDFVCITPVPLVNKYRFVDLLVPNSQYTGQNSLFVKNYYQIVMTIPDGTEIASVIVSTGAFVPRDVFLKVQEIQRKYKMLSERYIGVPTYLLKVRKYGENCPQCWDEVKHESRDSHCPTCYGIGKTGGYFDPELLTGHFEVSPQTQQITPERGLIDHQEANFRAIADPVIDPYDILIEKDTNQRWSVFRQTQFTAHKRVLVSQIVAIREIPRSHVIYEFPIPEQDSFEPQVPDADALLATGRDPGDRESIV